MWINTFANSPATNYTTHTHALMHTQRTFPPIARAFAVGECTGEPKRIVIVVTMATYHFTLFVQFSHSTANWNESILLGCSLHDAKLQSAIQSENVKIFFSCNCLLLFLSFFNIWFYFIVLYGSGCVCECVCNLIAPGAIQIVSILITVLERQK